LGDDTGALIIDGARRQDKCSAASLSIGIRSEAPMVWPEEPADGCGTQEKEQFNRAALKLVYYVDFLHRNKVSILHITYDEQRRISIMCIIQFFR